MDNLLIKMVENTGLCKVTEFNGSGEFKGECRCGQIFSTTVQKFLYAGETKCNYCTKHSVIRWDLHKNTETFSKEVSVLGAGDYELISEYFKSNKKVIIKHITCGNEFNMTPQCFIEGKRCPKCKSSKGEAIIRKILENSNKKYQSQYKISGCRNKRELPFDFAVFEGASVKFLIEFDGRQHFEPIEYFGGADAYIKTKLNDSIKTKYCNEVGLKLIRIPYWNINEIENILKEEDVC